MFYGITIFEMLEIFVFAGLFIGFAAYDNLILPLLILTVFLVFGYFVNHWDIPAAYHWVQNNQFETLMFFVGYLAAGIVWSLIKWKLFIRDVGILAKEEIKKGDVPTRVYLNGENVSLPLFASDHKQSLISWMIYWWISIPLTVLGDWFFRFWKQIYNLFSGVYQKMADKELAFINAEIAAKRTKNPSIRN